MYSIVNLKGFRKHRLTSSPKSQQGKFPLQALSCLPQCLGTKFKMFLIFKLNYKICRVGDTTRKHTEGLRVSCLFSREASRARVSQPASVLELTKVSRLTSSCEEHLGEVEDSVRLRVFTRHHIEPQLPHEEDLVGYVDHHTCRMHVAHRQTIIFIEGN